ncbi:MAG: cation diffusion facilitator family transporter [Corynebacterium sp.]|uniref:cation diffusion facilitator family transporter n=1 Tax=Corynebacterium sp. TaxID=1720 RepID=UPI0026DB79BB|nr:cation diffusion facilitator family transporter [Corynebacterium sp.]MDO5030297.1 cation diffusion facilitator family transporter [Corynebacterium sp.]
MQDLSRFGWLSVGAAVVTIALKFWGYVLTGSVGLLSDATESIVNLVAALAAVIALKVIARPADRDHEFGHSKAEYFSAGLEGAMIFVAAAYIIYASIERLINPQPIEQIGLGLIVTVAASVVNGVVALILIKAGREHKSVALTADGKHLMTDVWTSAGVLAGVFLVWLTGQWWLDPVIALAVAVNILFTGRKLILDAGHGLMDKAMEGEDREAVDQILKSHRDRSRGIDVHEIRTRVSGRQQFIEFHVLVPGAWSVEHGHDVLSDMEDELRERFPGVHISSHLEPIEDERAYGDVHL